ncbi:MAG: pyridoxal phosphate-dependent aminotransferase [Egibacteraceae bacterium]
MLGGVRDRQPHLTARLQGFGTTIFAEMTALAVAHDAINLGQGFPDFDPPAQVAEAAIQAIRDGHNQYAPGAGVPALRHAISRHQRHWYGLDYDPDGEVTVTAGATEAICATLQALCDTGDEAVLFEPMYDSHRASVAMAGAVERVVPLRTPDYRLDLDDLDAAVGPKTRLLLLNSPHNPTGKVFSTAELTGIARLCVERDIIAVTDEVYEHLVYDARHVPLATLPGMRERTVLVSSAGKTFNVTGWKVGWVCAPPPLTTAVRTAKQFMTFTNGTPFQHAVAVALELGDDYFEELRSGYHARRDRLAEGLTDVGFDVRVEQGSFFLTADIRPVGSHDGADFCRLLPERYGVAAVPCSAFCADSRRERHLVRFAYCKPDAVLDEGLRRLAALRPSAARVRT